MRERKRAATALVVEIIASDRRIAQGIKRDDFRDIPATVLVIMRQQFDHSRHPEIWREIAKERRAFTRRVALDAVDEPLPPV